MGVVLFIGLFDAILILSGVICLIGGFANRKKGDLFGTGIICLIFAMLFTCALASMYI